MDSLVSKQNLPLDRSVIKVMDKVFLPELENTLMINNVITGMKKVIQTEINELDNNRDRTMS